ncbi:MAG: hypothetical protein WAO71_08540 [Gallionella sp.]
MLTFAFVTEGITDQAVLENILYGIFGDEIKIKPLTPLMSAGNKPDGGWERLFGYCQSEKFRDFLRSEYCTGDEFIIVQIDTDTAEHPNFGVAINRPPIEIIADVKQLIVQKIGNDFYQQYQAQILIAVAVHSTECWLLPLYVSGKMGEQVMNCHDRLSRALNKKGDDASKNHQNYERLSKDFRNNETLLKAAKRNESLNDFVTQLQNVTVPS